MADYLPSKSQLHANVAEKLHDLEPLLDRFDVSGPRYTSYPTAVEFHDGVCHNDYQALLEAENLEKPDVPLSIYTHLPFCAERCTFCGCHIIITKKHEISEPYVEGLRKEIELVASHLPDRRKVQQFHFGGGTPTYLTPDQLTSLMGSFRSHFDIEPTAEVSVEVDPRVTTEAHVDALVASGFNRFSMGVQDFTSQVQEAINRVQTFHETRNLVEHIRARGVRYINIDLIYGLPFQTFDAFAQAVQQVISLRPSRLAVYSYAHVPWMKGHQKNFDEGDLPQGRDKFRLFLGARQLLLDAGYVAIGFDHFALPDDELTIAQQDRTLLRNFMGFTTKRGLDLRGFGVSAIGSSPGGYVQNEKKLPPYYQALEVGHLPTQRGLLLSHDDKVRGALIMDLFCNYYLDIRKFERDWSLSFKDTVKSELESLKPLEDLELVRVTDAAIEILHKGTFFIRNICMVFDRYYQKRGSETRFSKTI